MWSVKMEFAQMEIWFTAPTSSVYNNSKLIIKIHVWEKCRKNIYWDECIVKIYKRKLCMTIVVDSGNVKTGSI